MWLFGLIILLYLEFIQFASGGTTYHYRYTFYWEYEVDGTMIHNGSLHQLGKKGFDPARARLGVLMRGYYEDARIRTKQLNSIRFVIEETFQYEVGYIMHELYERYKKLVEQYNKGERNRSIEYQRLYKNKKPLAEPHRLIYGNEKIERTEVAQKLYFEIYHLTNMIHEITRKWGVVSMDKIPQYGLPPGVIMPDIKEPIINDTATYKNPKELQREREKHMKRLNEEKNRIMKERSNENDEKKKSEKSDKDYGIDGGGDARTNTFIRNRMKEYGWQKDRGNDSSSYRPKNFVHEYGWDATFSPGQDF